MRNRIEVSDTDGRELRSSQVAKDTLESGAHLTGWLWFNHGCFSMAERRQAFFGHRRGIAVIGIAATTLVVRWNFYLSPKAMLRHSETYHGRRCGTVSYIRSKMAAKPLLQAGGSLAIIKVFDSAHERGCSTHKAFGDHRPVAIENAVIRTCRYWIHG